MFDTVGTIRGGISLYERVNDVTKNRYFQLKITDPDTIIHQVNSPPHICTILVPINRYLPSVS
jgi:hypothetical protein